MYRVSYMTYESLGRAAAGLSMAVDVRHFYR